MPFDFLRLPAEIRIEIYQFALVFEAPIFVQSAINDRPAVFTLPCTTKKIIAKEHLDLLLTCRQMYAEALPIFYSQNEFYFVYMKDCGGYEDVLDFIGGIGLLRRGLLSHCTVFAKYLGTFGRNHNTLADDHLAHLIQYLKDSPGLKTEAFKIRCRYSRQRPVGDTPNGLTRLGVMPQETKPRNQGENMHARYWIQYSITNGRDGGNKSE